MHQNRQADQKDSQCRSQLQRRIAVGVAGRQVFEQACHLHFLLFGLREMIGAFSPEHFFNQLTEVTFMSEEKSLEQRVEELEAKVKELERSIESLSQLIKKLHPHKPGNPR